VVLIVIAGATGLIVAASQNGSSSTTNGSPSTTLASTASSIQPCSHAFSYPRTNTTTLSNGTQITHSAFPVFAADPGTTMTVCAQYANGNYSGPVYDSVYVWGSNGQFAQTHSASISASSSSIALTSVEHHSSIAQVAYSVALLGNSTGFYGILLFQFCAPLPLAVGYEPAQVDSSDFPGLFGVRSCPAQIMSGWIVGYSGATIDYLQSVSRYTPEINMSGVSVNSFQAPGGGDNITFKMAIRTYNVPLTVGLSLNQSIIRVFGGNPELTMLPSADYCSWYPNNDTAVTNYMTITAFQDLPSGYLVVNAPTLHLGTYMNTSYAFSILVRGPIANFTAIDPTMFVSVQDQGQGYTSIAAYFPVKIAGQIQSVSGLCYPGQ
jgi:hypothetical protein